ncbi:Gfo/Idh/MocA family protein [Lignipirellula cremea]|uniref:Inositol 2-dehydrogenase n=1 Tax=Lignipirellula cremea TaxID=2528010 RepID=A0A518E060_9BACT|nr:Gfo/Idh/MocA family oxidoreductase [Lignipirellula cremea]QDU97474.1 Inositol 2-dehydrogenase [Lignipirellula cremea]
MDRRKFLQQSSTGVIAGLGAAALANQAKAAPSERVRVGMIGSAGRAYSLCSTFSGNPNVEIVMVADVDPRRMPKALQKITENQGQAPKTTTDFRHIIDDDSIDAIVVGTPDHWHAIPTILGCLAGKDVYVEKPDGHNIVEGQRMVAAARKHGRVVQMGSQHRSTDRLISALDYIRTGALGKVLFAKAWESTRQRSIGNPPDSQPPSGVDYDMWLGAAPKRPFNPCRFHGNWRWFFDTGTGDLGNDGVHRLDMAFAAMNAACEAQGDAPCVLPRKISAMGGKRYFDDAQEFADTLQVAYEYESATPKILTYEMRIWAPYDMDDESEGAAIYGDLGYMIIGNERWRAYSSKGLVKEVQGDSFEGPHVQNFIDCIKSRNKPACDLETVGHPASLLCHAGNVAWRVGRSLTFDAATETFVGDEEANALRGRPEWRKPWVLPEV